MMIPSFLLTRRFYVPNNHWLHLFCVVGCRGSCKSLVHMVLSGIDWTVLLRVQFMVKVSRLMSVGPMLTIDQV